MSKRTKIILGIFIAILIILALFLLWWNVWRSPAVPATVIVNEPAEEQSASSPLAVPPLAQTSERNSTEISVETLGKTFAERFGSYSRESNFANINDLKPLMTNRLYNELSSLAANAESSTDYYGISTQVVSITIQAMDETAGTAELSILTQREEAIGSPTNSEVRYETLLLDLIKENGTWKVDQAVWQS